MIPDVSVQRTRIVELLEPLDLHVFEAAPSGTLPTQFVLIGMPSWKPPAEALCMHEIEWQLMVCVGRSGTNDTLTALALEGAWPQVVNLLDQAIEADASLGGICMTSSLGGAEFATVTIQGADLPAQIITLTMQGA